MNVFQQLVETNNNRIRVEQKVKDAKRVFEESIENAVQELKGLKEEEERLREEVVETLKKNNETTISIDDKILSRQIKTTLVIDDPDLLYQSLESQKDKLAELNLLEEEDLVEYFPKVTQINPEVKSILLKIIASYKDIEDKLFDGVIEQNTEYLTIKRNS